VEERRRRKEKEERKRRSDEINYNKLIMETKDWVCLGAQILTSSLFLSNSIRFYQNF
jgi:hypothetical protein